MHLGCGRPCPCPTTHQTHSFVAYLGNIDGLRPFTRHNIVYPPQRQSQYGVNGLDVNLGLRQRRAHCKQALRRRWRGRGGCTGGGDRLFGV